jgi:hypothetical protein
VWAHLVAVVVNDRIHILGRLSTSGFSNPHQVYVPDIENWIFTSPPPYSICNALAQGAATANTGNIFDYHQLKRAYFKRLIE